MLFVWAYPHEGQEMVFDAHNRAFAFFKGTGVYNDQVDSTAQFLEWFKQPMAGWEIYELYRRKAAELAR